MTREQLKNRIHELIHSCTFTNAVDETTEEIMNLIGLADIVRLSNAPHRTRYFLIFYSYGSNNGLCYIKTEHDTFPSYLYIQKHLKKVFLPATLTNIVEISEKDHKDWMVTPMPSPSVPAPEG